MAKQILLSKPLGTIAQEEAAARKANAKVKDGDWVWHVHHEQIAEQIVGDDGAEVRIDYILSDKIDSEVPLRLRLMRPVSKAWLKAQPEIVAAIKALEQARKEIRFNWTEKGHKRIGALKNKIPRLFNAAYPFTKEQSTWNGKTIFSGGWRRNNTEKDL